MKLPEIPAGHRWYVWRNRYNEIMVSLQERATYKKIWWQAPQEDWRTVESREAYDYYGKGESLKDQVERVAEEIVEKKKKSLRRRMEEEAIIGVYESNQNKALSD